MERAPSSVVLPEPDAPIMAQRPPDSSSPDVGCRRAAAPFLGVTERSVPGPDPFPFEMLCGTDARPLGVKLLCLHHAFTVKGGEALPSTCCATPGQGPGLEAQDAGLQSHYAAFPGGAIGRGDPRYGAGGCRGRHDIRSGRKKYGRRGIGGLGWRHSWDRGSEAGGQWQFFSCRAEGGRFNNTRGRSKATPFIVGNLKLQCDLSGMYRCIKVRFQG
jgi:hypothetical protein